MRFTPLISCCRLCPSGIVEVRSGNFRCQWHRWSGLGNLLSWDASSAPDGLQARRRHPWHTNVWSNNFGIFLREHTPLTSADIYVDDCIKHEKKIIFATPILHKDCPPYLIFLSIGQICQIHIALGLFTLLLYFKQFSKGNWLIVWSDALFNSHLFLNNLQRVILTDQS